MGVIKSFTDRLLICPLAMAFCICASASEYSPRPPRLYKTNHVKHALLARMRVKMRSIPQCLEALQAEVYDSGFRKLRVWARISNIIVANVSYNTQLIIGRIQHQ